MTLFNTPLYVFDSGPLIKMKDYPEDIFPSMWAKFHEMISTNQIISCREVYNEITQNYAVEDDISRWAKRNSSLFLTPQVAELEKVREILTKFPLLIREEETLSTKPQADPFVIAQAWENSCVLVHQEKLKPNAPKIPNVCAHFGVKELSLHAFFRERGWTF